jgi:hypothetical protein
MFSDFISGLIQGIYYVIEQILSSSKSKETVQEHIVKNEFVHKRLFNLLHDIEADRISIRQYHNGGNFYSGMPMQRYSCTYEVVGEGISAELPNCQNKFVSETPILHSGIIKDKEFYIKNVKELEDQSFKQKLEKRGVRTFYASGIWDIQDNLVGLICSEYVVKHHEVTQKDKEEIADFAKLVVGYLSIQPVTKKSLVVTIIVFSFAIITFLSQLLFVLSIGYDIFNFIFHFYIK